MYLERYILYIDPNIVGVTSVASRGETLTH
jgi:hypothetical protein